MLLEREGEAQVCFERAIRTDPSVKTAATRELRKAKAAINKIDKGSFLAKGFKKSRVRLAKTEELRNKLEEAFDEGQCIQIETDYRKGHPCTTVWGRQFPAGQNKDLKCMVDFEDMTACIFGCVESCVTCALCCTCVCGSERGV